jgi:RNase P subunit RPR2
MHNQTPRAERCQVVIRTNTTIRYQSRSSHAKPITLKPTTTTTQKRYAYQAQKRILIGSETHPHRSTTWWTGLNATDISILRPQKTVSCFVCYKIIWERKISMVTLQSKQTHARRTTNNVLYHCNTKTRQHVSAVNATTGTDDTSVTDVPVMGNTSQSRSSVFLQDRF